MLTKCIMVSNHYGAHYGAMLYCQLHLSKTNEKKRKPVSFKP